MSFFRLKHENPLPWSGADYISPPEFKKKLSAIFPNISYYWNMIFTVFRAGRIAYRGKYSPEEWVQSSYEIIRGMEQCGTVVSVMGMENFLNIDGPCVFVGNHMSTLETFVLPCLIQPHKEVTFVVKDSLLKYPFFGPVLASRDPIIVTRKNLKADLTAMLQGGAERLAAGRSIIVFPQSSRSLHMDPKHFNSIGVKMAKKAGVPLIPVALRTDSWGTGRLIKDFGPIRPSIGARFKFGKAIYVEGNGKAEHAAIVEFISKNLGDWGLPALSAGEAPKELTPGESENE